MESYNTILKKLNDSLNAIEIKTEYDESYTRPTRVHVTKAAKTLSHEVTKIALLLQELRAEPAFFKNIEESIDVFRSMFQGFSAYSGPSLFKEGQAHFKRIYKSILDMLLEYQENEEKLGDEEENIVSKERIGTAWKSCEMFEKIPLRNNVAILSRLSEISAIIGDAFEEIDEVYDAVETYKQRSTDDNSLENIKKDKKKDDSEDEDDEEEEEEEEEELIVDENDEDFVLDQEDIQEDEMSMLNEQEIENIGNLHTVGDECGELCYYFFAHISEFEKTLEDPDDYSKDTPEQTNQFEDVFKELNQIATLLDDVASGMYPPQNQVFMTGQLAYLESVIEKVQKVFKTMGISKPPTNHEQLISQLQIK